MTIRRARSLSLALALTALPVAVLADDAIVDQAVVRALSLLTGDGRDEAAAALDDDALMRRAPGLRGALLAARGDHAGACVHFEKESAREGIVGAAAARRAFLCLDAAAAPERTTALARRVLADPRLAKDALTLAETLDETARRGVDVRAALAEHALSLPISTTDTARREAHARVLAALVDEKSAAKRARALLLVDLAETIAAESVWKTQSAASWRAALGDDGLLARARVLEARHGNDALLTTLGALAFAADDVSDRACEARFLVGKTERKKRRYQRAREALDAVSSSCGEPWKKKARYTNARVAAFALTGDALAVADAFIAAYPSDALTDDVMVWKAEILSARGQTLEAERVYADLVERFPDGDMALHARFTRAFSVAMRGETRESLALLDELSRAAERASPLERDQAHYWRARLEAFPRLDRLTLTDDESARARGLAALAALARARPAGYYGHLARALVVEHGDATLLGALPPAISRPDQRALAASVRAESPVMRDALTLYSAGFVDEAARVVDAALASRGRAPIEEAMVDAALYALVGRDDRAHQVMRAAGHALLAGAPSSSSSLVWALAYPRAHDAALGDAARGEAIPPELLMALAREESAFDAAVTSWAGALGLCQLMPPTAREEATRKRLKEPTVELLRTPELNARLGAAHLARRIVELGHPFYGIAAYNAGPGNVAKWKRDLPTDAWVESIPVEQTRMYVKKVTGSWVAYSILDGGAPVHIPLALPKRKK